MSDATTMDNVLMEPVFVREVSMEDIVPLMLVEMPVLIMESVKICPNGTKIEPTMSKNLCLNSVRP